VSVQTSIRLPSRTEGVVKAGSPVRYEGKTIGRVRNTYKIDPEQLSEQRLSIDLDDEYEPLLSKLEHGFVSFMIKVEPA